MKRYIPLFESNDIYYHGSDKSFDKFSKRTIKRGESIFLTPDIEYAKVYGKYIYKVQPISNNIFFWAILNNKSSSSNPQPQYKLEYPFIFSKIELDNIVTPPK